MRRGLIMFAALLAGCAAEAPAPTPGPAAQQGPVQPVLTATDVEEGVIRVSGWAADKDALAAHHCTAARHARAGGAPALIWLGGVARRDEGGEQVVADLVYRIEAKAGAPVRGAAPAEGRAAPVEDWLIYCDEAGVPREGEA
ncbi:MAG: hypothetical protein ACK5MQ_08940 [Pikeienuella sp.]